MIVEYFGQNPPTEEKIMKKAFENFIEKSAEKYRVEAFKGERMLSSWLTEDAQKEYMKELSGRSNFLREINWLTVAEPSGKTLFGALDGTTTGRQKDERHRSRLIHRDQYQTQEADSGVFIPWQLIDELTSLQENFEENYTALTESQFVLDMLQIGWNGESVAQNTQASDLSDVNIGWQAQLKQKKPEHIITQGKKAGRISLFAENADYKNLNELAAKEDAIYANTTENQRPGDTVANSHYLANYYGGMPAVIPPCFPPKGAVVTTFRNLSIYTQRGSVYRAIYDDENKVGVINSFRRNDAYVVEKVDFMTAIEPKNVVFSEK